MFHRLRHICCWRRGHRIFVCKWREQRARQGVICRKKASLVLVGGPASRRHHRSTNPNPAISFLFYFLDYKVGVGGARQQKANWRLFWRHHATGPGTLVRCSYRAMPLPPFNLRPTDAMDVWDVCEARQGCSRIGAPGLAYYGVCMCVRTCPRTRTHACKTDARDWPAMLYEHRLLATSGTGRPKGAETCI